MKIALCLVVLGVGMALTTPVHEGKQYKTVDHDFLQKQYKVLSLFKHIEQPSLFEEHVKIYQPVTDPIQWLQTNKAHYEKPMVVDTMIEFMHYDYMLPKGTPFSMMYEEHLEQAVALFKLFYYAKDFDTFYQTAVVMHQFVNEAMFLYSTSVAVVHRPDCYGIILPPIHEVYPWKFYNTEVIQEAYHKKMTYDEEHMTEADHHHYIYSNYSGHYLNLHWEQSLSYFTEDVGVNSFFYYYNIHYPHWMNGTEFHIHNDYRGEIFLTVLRSLLARYYLERLTHGEGQIPYIDWEVPFETPYYPSLQYPSGLPFPERPKFAQLEDHYHTYGQKIKTKQLFSHKNIQNFERRMMDAIDGGYYWDPETKAFEHMYDAAHHNEYVNAFGNLLQCNPDSKDPKYFKNYTMYATHLLGYSPIPLSWKQAVPAALEHAETAMRDPAFYQLIKKMLMYYGAYQTHYMTPYTKEELQFPGVNIDKVEMDRLITYFDQFYGDISNAVWDTTDELKNDKFQVFAVQKRLNHKPFTYKIYVNSHQDTKAMVKVFLGPKVDEYGRHISIQENRWNFVPIDAFQWHLTTGQNVIKRSSQESEFFAHDKTTYADLYKKVMGAYNGQGEFHVTGKENYFYFPHRMMLPMGTYNGMPYQFYFIVYPYKPYTGQKEEMTYFYPRPGTGGGFLDDHNVFYPFDKPVKFEKMFVEEVPNSYFYEAKVYHRTAEEAQVPVTHQHQH